VRVWGKWEREAESLKMRQCSFVAQKNAVENAVVLCRLPQKLPQMVFDTLIFPVKQDAPA
jgi:hypothetical protein